MIASGDRKAQISNRRGYSLLEVIIATALLSALLLMIMEITTSATKTHSTASALTESQVLLHTKMEEIFAELLEGNPAYVWTATFADPLIGGQSRQAIVFLSARLNNGSFQVVNGSPSWQSVVVYCPYSTTVAGVLVHELRRYEYTPDPSLYTSDGFVMTFTATATTLTLPQGVTFTRSGGTTILRNLQSLTVTGSYPLRLSITTLAKSLDSSIAVPLTTELAGRNKN